jgi:exodeoxyribonuclease V alpha subunit
LTILSRAGVPKVRGEIMQSDLGENFAHKVAADPSHIKRLFPRIKEAGTEDILTACQKAAAGNEIFQALNAVGANQKAIDAAIAFDLEKQDVYDLIERGLQFARADALAQHPAIQTLQPFNRHSASRITHAALVQVKEYCGLWGHTGLPLADILKWLGLTYGLDPEVCAEALVLGANKRGLHVDDGPNRHIFLKEHYEAECKIFRMVCALAGMKSRRGSKTKLPKSAHIMVGSLEERPITFSRVQLECLAGLIEWTLSILTGGPGAGKTTLIAALNDHYERLLVVALAAKAGLRAHEVSGANHTTIASILDVPDGDDRWLSGVQVLVIEEASMIGSIQMAGLFEAALSHGVRKIILVGDPNQLAPIHNGSPFIDLIRSGKVPVFRLTENHRTDPASLGIAGFCGEILEGKVA